mmetsp:Transcript_35647/g.61137  ORF Transcript_35647/g.61137 Transcript_35647/m.61137 type:complete len:248 (+) Transcript_35647:368-1111(+)
MPLERGSWRDLLPVRARRHVRVHGNGCHVHRRAGSLQGQIHRRTGRRTQATRRGACGPGRGARVARQPRHEHGRGEVRRAGDASGLCGGRAIRSRSHRARCAPRGPVPRRWPRRTARHEPRRQQVRRDRQQPRCRRADLAWVRDKRGALPAPRYPVPGHGLRSWVVGADAGPDVLQGEPRPRLLRGRVPVAELEGHRFEREQRAQLRAAPRREDARLPIPSGTAPFAALHHRHKPKRQRGREPDGMR